MPPPVSNLLPSSITQSLLHVQLADASSCCPCTAGRAAAQKSGIRFSSILLSQHSGVVHNVVDSFESSRQLEKVWLWQDE
jgi:hypothetical protein